MANEAKTLLNTRDVVTDVLKTLATRHSNSLSPRDVPAVADAVTREVTSVVVNATNSEPWYQSRVTWGAIIAVAGGIAGIAGYAVDAEDQAQVVNGVVGVVTAIGGLVAWYGRWRAKKPIGE